MLKLGVRIFRIITVKREKDRQKEEQTNKDRDRKQKERERETERDRERQKDRKRQTDRQTDKERERDKDRDRQRKRYKEEREREKMSLWHVCSQATPELLNTCVTGCDKFASNKLCVSRSSTTVFPRIDRVRTIYFSAVVSAWTIRGGGIIGGVVYYFAFFSF